MTVNENRLWERLKALARVGAVPSESGGGIVRPAFGPAHAEAVRLVAGWMTEAGLTAGLDSTGNLIGLWPGTCQGAPALAIGSHLDTVPHGGGFDGALGVLAALEAVHTMAERGERLQRPIAVLGLADEEGNNFGIGVLSSQLWTGEILPEEFPAIRDPDGRGLDAYLDAFEINEVPCFQRPELAAFLEAHIEQGPVLESKGHRAAAVESIVGISRTTVRFTGQANHGGTTPMELRRDALWGAAELALAVRDLAIAGEGRVVATVGVLEVSPGATNVVPGAAALRVEIRSPDVERLAAMRAAVEATANASAARFELGVKVGEWHLAPPVPMDPNVLEATRRALTDAGLDPHVMPSWAGHDAKVFARHVPVGMVFVPSVGGISHAPDEYTHPLDCATAAELLYHAVRRTDTALGVPVQARVTVASS